MFFKNKNKKLPLGWSGNYKTWEEASALTAGYDQGQILQKVKSALLKVKNNEAAFERDSVLFYKKEYSWPLLAILLKTSIENDNCLNLLDFGGSLGSTYYQHRDFFSSLKKIRWSIVEQKHFAEEGKKTFENEELKFYDNIEKCLQENSCNTLLASSVVQYLKAPYKMIENIKEKSIPNLIFDRTAFVENDNDILTVQNVPPHIYEASYPAWFFNKEKFIQFLSDRYELVSEFDTGITPPVILEGNKAYWQGLFFKLKK
jgi:putative methyltransferase (TIGR04325 family)